MKLNKRIFDSAEDIKEAYGIDVKIPDDLPDGCNIISWEFNNSNDVSFYKQIKDELLFYGSFSEDWCRSGNVNLESEVSDDMENGYNYIYLHLTQQENKEKFTPQRLLGVETNTGYVRGVYFTEDFEPQIVTVQICNKHLYHPCSLRYYISDDSDETVSFYEYLDMFYERSSL